MFKRLLHFESIYFWIKETFKYRRSFHAFRKFEFLFAFKQISSDHVSVAGLWTLLQRKFLDCLFLWATFEFEENLCFESFLFEKLSSFTSFWYEAWRNSRDLHEINYFRENKMLEAVWVNLGYFGVVESFNFNAAKRSLFHRNIFDSQTCCFFHSHFYDIATEHFPRISWNLFFCLWQKIGKHRRLLSEMSFANVIESSLNV